MAARHHQSKRSRKHEHMGMERYERGPVKERHHEGSSPSGAIQAKYREDMSRYEGYYAGAEPRRRREMEDAGMIHEDHSKIANLPQEVMIKHYEMTGPYMDEVMDDSIRGVDHQMDSDDRQSHRFMNPKKVG